MQNSIFIFIDQHTLRLNAPIPSSGTPPSYPSSYPSLPPDWCFLHLLHFRQGIRQGPQVIYQHDDLFRIWIRFFKGDLRIVPSPSTLIYSDIVTLSLAGHISIYPNRPQTTAWHLLRACPKDLLTGLQHIIYFSVRSSINVMSISGTSSSS